MIVLYAPIPYIVSHLLINQKFISLHRIKIRIMRKTFLLLILSFTLSFVATDICAQDTSKADAEYSELDEFPTFKGGTPVDFAYWVAGRLKYPEDAKTNGIEGMVKVKFVVGKKGKIEEAYIEQGVHPLLDAEALRVVMKSPKWKPAKKNGSPVKVSYTIPVVFSLK